MSMLGGFYLIVIRVSHLSWFLIYTFSIPCSFFFFFLNDFKFNFLSFDSFCITVYRKHSRGGKAVLHEPRISYVTTILPLHCHCVCIRYYCRSTAVHVIPLTLELTLTANLCMLSHRTSPNAISPLSKTITNPFLHFNSLSLIYSRLTLPLTLPPFSLPFSLPGIFSFTLHRLQQIG